MYDFFMPSLSFWGNYRTSTHRNHYHNNKNVIENSHLKFPKDKLCLVTLIFFYNLITGFPG